MSGEDSDRGTAMAGSYRIRAGQRGVAAEIFHVERAEVGIREVRVCQRCPVVCGAGQHSIYKERFA